MSEFDFIVVGGGPGGCVTASRLTEDPGCSVALLEAGPDWRGWLADNTALSMLKHAPRKSSNNWGFNTLPDPGLNNRSDFHSLGRGLGGGTSFNALVYMRGHRGDYDEWAALGNPGWSYADVLPYFRKLENNQTFRDEYHGNDGPMWVEDMRTDNPYHDVVKQACREAGEPIIADFNGATQVGCGSVQATMKNGERWHTGKAYIHPYLGTRQNLHLMCETHCTRVLFEGRRAVGVEVIQGGQRRVLRARREVIVCGGGILSAKLLLLSGVGPGAELQAMGIPVVHESPAVGRHLHDHPAVTLAYHIPGDPNLMGISPTGALAILRAIRRWRKERRGMGATNFGELSGYFCLRPDSPRPEVQCQFVIGVALDHGRDVYAKHGMSVVAILLRPGSRGSVRLASTDPLADPLVDFRYFSHPDDLPTMVAGLRRIAGIMKTPTMSRRIKRDLLTEHCRTDEDWAEFARNRAGTVYHPVGSCRMGSDPSDAVVDARLRVHGLQGLRVIDSSIMPRIVGGNTMAPSIMIGEKGADMIKQDLKGAA